MIPSNVPHKASRDLIYPPHGHVLYPTICGEAVKNVLPRWLEEVRC